VIQATAHPATAQGVLRGYHAALLVPLIASGAVLVLTLVAAIGLRARSVDPQPASVAVDHELPSELQPCA
jgi:hypothetical protein